MRLRMDLTDGVVLALVVCCVLGAMAGGYSIGHSEAEEKMNREFEQRYQEKLKRHHDGLARMMGPSFHCTISPKGRISFSSHCPSKLPYFAEEGFIRRDAAVFK